MSTTIPERIDTSEGTRGTYTATLEKPNGDPIALADLSTLTLTLKDRYAGSVINSRNAQNVLNMNNVTFHATTGLLTWDIQALDNPIVSADRKGPELHIATFKAAPWLGWDVYIYVKRLGKAV
mgnify:CR=1 FL=1